MNEVKVALANQLLEQRQLGQLLKSWQVGQLVQARVLDSAANGRLLLGVGAERLVATSDLAVARGAQLTLQVERLYPVPTLQVRNVPLHSPVVRSPEQQKIQHLLPRQGSVSSPLLSLFDPASEVKILSVLEPEAQSRLNLTFSQLGLLTSLKGLQESVARSGLFLESDLARHLVSREAANPQDIKATLLRLQQQLAELLTRGAVLASAGIDEAALATLRSQVEGALAAITLNQLAVTAPEVRPGGIWLFDMPFLVRGVLRDLHLTIERRDSETRDAEAGLAEWHAVVRVTLARLGLVEAELFLARGRVSVALYAESADGARLLNERTALLQDTLEQCGLEVSVLCVHHGTRAAVPEDARWQPGLDVTV